jgi:hypothetical protein
MENSNRNSVLLAKSKITKPGTFHAKMNVTKIFVFIVFTMLEHITMIKELMI